MIAELKTFSSTAKKKVVGLRYVSGTLGVGNLIKVLRNNEEVARGKIKNLQQARADVKEIKVEGEFGAELEVREELSYGDTVIAFAPQES